MGVGQLVTLKERPDDHLHVARGIRSRVLKVDRPSDGIRAANTFSQLSPLKGVGGLPLNTGSLASSLYGWVCGAGLLDRPTSPDGVG